MNHNISFPQHHEHTNAEHSANTNAASLFPAWFIVLLAIFCYYLAVPIIDVPLLGLSLSAPVFFILAMHALFRLPMLRFHQQEKWVLLAAALWLGVAASFFVN